MKKVVSLVFVTLFALQFALSQSFADTRAARMGVGMNVSFLENFWSGNKSKHYSDLIKQSDVAKHEKEFADIAKAGFKTVRIPICFSAWMELKRPYEWDNPQALETVDLFVKWALANGLNVIIDLHHPEFDGTVPETENPERLVNLWLRIAERYKNTDPEKVFFELRNEPHKMPAETWRWQAEQMIKIVRETAPNHTLIVGFHDWNGRQAMLDSQPFADKNIIYTFHYYDPFLFTHQASTWSGAEGIEEIKLLPFPAVAEKMPKTPKNAQGKWVEKLISSYATDSKADRMYKDLKAAKDWSVKYKVPIFVGEFGSYGQDSSMDDRCRHAGVVYSALGKLQIPNAWWEWDGGFNMFKPGTTEISDCMRKAIDSYKNQN